MISNRFDHYAPFVEAHSRIEMRLISRGAISWFTWRGLDKDFHFEVGEYIHTENSYKYTLESFGSLCKAAGMKMGEYWLDERELVCGGTVPLHFNAMTLGRKAEFLLGLTQPNG